MQCEILLEDGQLLRDVSDPALERSNPAGDIRDLSRQSSFLRACCRESGLNISELAAVVTGGRSGEHEPGNNGNGQSAGHSGRFGEASDVPAAAAVQPPERPSSGPSGPGSGSTAGLGSGMTAGSGGLPSSGGG